MTVHEELRYELGIAGSIMTTGLGMMTWVVAAYAEAPSVAFWGQVATVGGLTLSMLLGAALWALKHPVRRFESCCECGELEAPDDLDPAGRCWRCHMLRGKYWT